MAARAVTAKIIAITIKDVYYAIYVLVPKNTTSFMPSTKLSSIVSYLVFG